MTEKMENSNKNRFEDMSALVPTNFLSDSTKHNLQLETDEAAVISLLANQLSQQQTQLTGPVLQDEGKMSLMRIFYKLILSLRLFCNLFASHLATGTLLRFHACRVLLLDNTRCLSEHLTTIINSQLPDRLTCLN